MFFRKYAHNENPTPSETTPAGSSGKRRLPGSTALWAAVFLIVLHLGIWPFIWRVVLLPQSRPEQHRLGVTPAPGLRVEGTRIFLDRPDSSATAGAVWHISRSGLYRLRLACDDNGRVLIDGRPVISLDGVNARNVGEVKTWLTPGPHLLGLHLGNGPGKGWLTLEVSGPGRLDQTPGEGPTAVWFWTYPDGDRFLSLETLSYLDPETLATWMTVVSGVEYLTLAGGLILTLWWLARMVVRRRSGRLFPNRKWALFFLGMAVTATGGSLLYHTMHPIPPVWSDGLGQYSYLPSYVVYHDPTLESVFGATRRYDYPADGFTGSDLAAGEGFLRAAGTGRYLLKYPIGTAVLEMPFFLTAHLLAPLFGSKADGFSAVYQWAVAAAAVFYLMAGLWVLFKVLSSLFPLSVVAVTLASLFWGTNLLAYAALEPSYSHIYSFFLVCLILYLTPRWSADPSPARTLALGLTAGLVLLIRLPNLLFLLVIPLFGLFDRETLKGRVAFLRREKKMVFLLLITVFLVVAPQLLIWKTASGHFFPDTYPNLARKFFFLSPSVRKVLFSFHHGLFIWSPILIFSLWGFLKVRGPWKAYAWAIGISLGLHLYIVSSWTFWFFGGVFGHRAFVEALGLLALPLAAFYGSLRTRAAKSLAGAVSTFLVILTFFLFSQALLGVLPSGMRPFITPTMYSSALGDPSGMAYFRTWIQNPKVNYRLLR